MDWMIHIAGLITMALGWVIAIRKELRETEKHEREMKKDIDNREL